MTYVQRMLRLMMESVIFEREDVPAIKDLARMIPLDDVNVVRDVNQALKEQIELEAAIVYLTNKYRALKHRAEDDRDSCWSRLARDIGQRSVDRPLDPQYLELSRRFVEYKCLTELLADICGNVYARRDKLEQLSVNYRVESRDAG